MLTLTWFIVFLILLFLGVPMAVSIGMAAIVAFTFANISGLIVPLNMIASLDSFLLLAVPFFIFTGIIMKKAQIADKLFDFANAIVGWLPGGLGSVNVVISMIFGGISGSSSADVAGLGPLEIHAMEIRKYPKDYSTAITVASSILSSVIPPSVILIIYAFASGVSPAAVLAAGLFPGILLGIGMIILNTIMAFKYNFGSSVEFSLRNIWEKFKIAFPALLTPVILLVGIFLGTFTPTEVGAAAVFYTIFISAFVYKTLNFKCLVNCFYETIRMTGATLIIVGSSALVSYIIGFENIPALLVDFFVSLTDSPLVILLVLNVLLIILGSLVEGVSIILLVAPILVPLILKFGINPVQFGVIMIANLALGLITPPVGVCLYIGVGISGVPYQRLVRSLIPFFVTILICLIIINLWPGLSLFLPNLLF